MGQLRKEGGDTGANPNPHSLSGQPQSSCLVIFMVTLSDFGSTDLGSPSGQLHITQGEGDVFLFPWAAQQPVPNPGQIVVGCVSLGLGLCSEKVTLSALYFASMQDPQPGEMPPVLRECFASLENSGVVFLWEDH